MAPTSRPPYSRGPDAADDAPVELGSLLSWLPKNRPGLQIHILKWDLGAIKLLGRELRGADDATLRSLRGNEIAVIFQEPMTALNPVYTVGFQIMESLRSHDRSLSPNEAKARATPP